MKVGEKADADFNATLAGALRVLAGLACAPLIAVLLLGAGASAAGVRVDTADGVFAVGVAAVLALMGLVLALVGWHTLRGVEK